MRKIGKASDPLKAFVRARCAERAGSEEKAADLHRAFQAWAEDHNQLSSKAFGSRLAELGYSREKRGGVVRYSGLSSPATSATGGQILVGVAARCGGEQHGVLYGAQHGGRDGGNRPGQRIWKLLL